MSLLFTTSLSTKMEDFLSNEKVELEGSNENKDGKEYYVRMKDDHSKGGVVYSTILDDEEVVYKIGHHSPCVDLLEVLFEDFGEYFIELDNEILHGYDELKIDNGNEGEIAFMLYCLQYMHDKFKVDFDKESPQFRPVREHPADAYNLVKNNERNWGYSLIEVDVFQPFTEVIEEEMKKIS